MGTEFNSAPVVIRQRVVFLFCFSSGGYDVLYKMTGTLTSHRQRLWILCVVLLAAAGGEKHHFLLNNNNKKKNVMFHL